MLYDDFEELVLKKFATLLENVELENGEEQMNKFLKHHNLDIKITVTGDPNWEDYKIEIQK